MYINYLITYILFEVRFVHNNRTISFRCFITNCFNFISISVLLIELL